MRLKLKLVSIQYRQNISREECKNISHVLSTLEKVVIQFRSVNNMRHRTVMPSTILFQYLLLESNNNYKILQSVRANRQVALLTLLVAFLSEQNCDYMLSAKFLSPKQILKNKIINKIKANLYNKRDFLLVLLVIINGNRQTLELLTYCLIICIFA